jgi:hypothetical protein
MEQNPTFLEVVDGGRIIACYIAIGAALSWARSSPKCGRGMRPDCSFLLVNSRRHRIFSQVVVGDDRMGNSNCTNVLSETSWVLTLNGHLLADSDSHVNRRKKALQRLFGKRLLALHIDQQSQSTVVKFSRGVTLTTAPMPGSREHRPHWLLRISEKEWPPVALMGTAYRWRSENRRFRRDC